MKAGACDGWAICSDYAGIMLHTAAYTRRGAIKNFLDTFYGEDRHTFNDWRRLKKNGWRASRIIVDELIFGAKP